MWYFSWVLGLGLACSFAILNAMWLEVRTTTPAPSRTAIPTTAIDRSVRVRAVDGKKTPRPVGNPGCPFDSARCGQIAGFEDDRDA